MSNPYAIPQTTPSPGMLPPNVPHYSATVQQLPVFAILMMVHGGIVMLAALGIGLMAAVMPLVAVNPNGGAIEADEEMALRMMTLVYGGIAIGVGIVGVMQLWAGWRTYRFQRRLLGVFGVVAAFLSSITCYCAATGIPLGIWGLILLLHPDVQHGYALQTTGMTRDEIMRYFSSVQPQPTPSDQEKGVWTE